MSVAIVCMTIDPNVTEAIDGVTASPGQDDDCPGSDDSSDSNDEQVHGCGYGPLSLRY